MIPEVHDKILGVFCDVSPPFSGSIAQWAYENIKLPQVYSQPGRVDISTSPWLIPPLEDVLNPRVRMIIKIMGIRIGKSMTDEITIPYWISQAPSPILRVHQDDDMAATITETKLLPILQTCDAISPMLPRNKGGKISKGLIKFPHMFIRISGDKETIAHSIGVRYLVMDEAHLYEFGLIEKFIGRTVDFAGRRKIIISSTPNHGGSELEKYYLSGNVWEWQWCCPSCNKHQPYYWSKQREDGLSYAGFNWDTILAEDGEHTDIAKSAKTTWLECYFCKHQVHDNIANRRMLNDTAKYVCIKSDGYPEIRAYTVPLFVNHNLSFESFTIQYLAAKRVRRKLGLDEDLVTFVTQVLAKFYHAEPQSDHSKIARGDYIPNPTEYDKNWVNIMTCDYQAIGAIKYYVVRAWNKNGNESRRLAFGICRTWEEINEARKKWNVRVPCVGVDSGFSATEVYQTCIRFGEKFNDPVLKKEIFTTFVPMKGDGAKLSYTNHLDKISRYYAPLSSQDSSFPQNSKYYGIPAKLLLWSNYSIKSILMDLRDQKVPGVKWLVDFKDNEYEKQLYSEELREEVDKKTGQKKARWIKVGDSNEYLDAEAENLTLAIRYNVFSPTKINEDELKKAVPEQK